jgi:hypothetical protein
MASEESTVDLSDEELTQRLRLARGQSAVRAATADSIADQLRKGADAMKIRGVSIDSVLIDDPIRDIDLVPLPSITDPYDPSVYEHKIEPYWGTSTGRITTPYVSHTDIDVKVSANSTDLRFDNCTGETK